ncbi:hypothetical protein WR25_13957 [Diploscapter pachys]|uniref:C2H2-type domain-containing protein n=1 Tax=Diploscapter pachys TaxID=2018661 RepID=A0A2A2JED5_9BILA|nr:hypothetical protein WR25_13957 [Diploscapter pachys]
MIKEEPLDEVEDGNGDGQRQAYRKMTLEETLQQYEEQQRQAGTASTPLQSIKCPLCDTYKKSSKALENHLCEHLGYYPYKCDICPEARGSAEKMEKHCKLAHGLDGAKMTFKSDAAQSAELEQLLAHAMNNSIMSTAARFMTDQPCDSSVFGAFSFSPLCEFSVNEDSLSVGTCFPMKSEVPGEEDNVNVAVKKADQQKQPMHSSADLRFSSIPASPSISNSSRIDATMVHTAAISESGVDVPSGDEEEKEAMELGKESDSDWSPTTPRVNTKRRPRISANSTSSTKSSQDKKEEAQKKAKKSITPGKTIPTNYPKSLTSLVLLRHSNKAEILTHAKKSHNNGEFFGVLEKGKDDPLFQQRIKEYSEKCFGQPPSPNDKSPAARKKKTPKPKVVKPSIPDSYFCGLCNKDLHPGRKSEKFLQHVGKHMNDTFGIRRFSCKNCDYATCDRSSILKHRREKCPEVEGYDDNILLWTPDKLANVSFMIMNDRTYVTERMPGKWVQKFDKAEGSQGKKADNSQKPSTSKAKSDQFDDKKDEEKENKENESVAKSREEESDEEQEEEDEDEMETEQSNNQEDGETEEDNSYEEEYMDKE